MTYAELGFLKPSKSVLKIGSTKVLFKFLVYHQDIGYSICYTQDFANPEPRKRLDTDCETTDYKAVEIVKL